jgi:hypothetical protein
MGIEDRFRKTNYARSHTVEKWTPEDISDELSGEPELLRYMRLLPRTLWSRHFEALERIQNEHTSDGPEAVAERRINYILSIVQARERAIIEFDTHEPFFHGKLSSEKQAEVFGKDLHETLVSTGNTLGAGQTARVKSMKVRGMPAPIAVKYLLTPTEKTLSVQGEHDMLYEVETLTQIEHKEADLGAGAHIRVPHPFFFYKRGSLQCYGMTQINGVGLDKVIQGDGNYDPIRDEVVNALQERFASVETRNTLHREIDVFMNAVHEVCRHGDIKLANIMVDTEGVFYLIDFGQSISTREMSEDTREKFENLAENERGQMHECIRGIWNHI